MSSRPTYRIVRTLATAACVFALLAQPVAGAPSAAGTASHRAALERAVAEYEAARAESASLDARLAAASAELDTLIAEEDAARARLRSRVQVMYRLPDADFLSMLLGASSMQEFVTRWDLLSRIVRQDTATIGELEAARERAGRSAEELIALQTEQARSLDELSSAVARARESLAASEAALREYETRTSATTPQPSRAKAASGSSKADPTQQLTGNGEWKTAVASHYGRNFTGRGASGEAIGPYSMIVAHKTLPFGTLIEFEYNGKRCVAKVADRGPHVAGREFDLGPGVVRVLGFSGVHQVRYRLIAR